MALFKLGGTSHRQTSNRDDRPTQKRRYSSIDLTSDSENDSSIITKAIKRHENSGAHLSSRLPLTRRDRNGVIRSRDLLEASNDPNHSYSQYSDPDLLQGNPWEEPDNSIGPRSQNLFRNNFLESSLSSSQNSSAELTVLTPNSSQDSQTSLTPLEKHNDPNYMSLQDRKRYALYEFLPTRIHILRKWMKYYLDAIPKDKKKNDCWIYSSARLPSSRNSICYASSYRYKNKSRRFSFHYGFIALLVKGQLTDEEKEGIIEEGWHASHLCGNWPCCNPRHIQPEPGNINQDRKTCFRTRRSCQHYRPCMTSLQKESSTFRTLPAVSPDFEST
ncbi:hypothetical protein AOQ84DRAFT_365885 [Glonium stellatum]|uniref:Zinc-binding loop region of homing endonuclease domain-containing protein n=1 Tax=Glonium stellatum TaxID=574774 RepID=A0A8E2JRE6_9PEZI|nr:hypothetical protein AOQ84DRAFT_365885 [Glonium stellatum]